MKIFSIRWLKTAAIANPSHFSRGRVYRYRTRDFLSLPDPFVDPSCAPAFFVPPHRALALGIHRSSPSLSLLLFPRPLIVVSLPAHTYLRVLRCRFYRITLCPSALFVRLCTLLIRAANRIRIRLNLSPLADVSLALRMH